MAARDWLTGALTATTVAVAPAAMATSQQTGIPYRALTAYVQAADQSSCGVLWQDLAAVGHVESGHGTHGGAHIDGNGKLTQPIVSWAGAEGPMQFMTTHDVPTWQGYVGLGLADGDHDGATDVNDIDDAARAAGEYLCRNGYTPADPTEAWGRYNGGADWRTKGESLRYVSAAAKYRATLPADDVQAAPDLIDRLRSAWHSLITAIERAFRITTTVTSTAASAGRIVSIHGIEVDESIAPQVRNLLADAEADGIVLGGSGWRSTDTQRQLRIRNGCPDIDVSPASSCSTPTALPGHSRHEQGLAIDFTDRYGNSLTADSEEFRWLSANAAQYGLHNLPSEAWHWSTDGR